MKIFSFSDSHGTAIHEYGSRGFTYTNILEADDHCQIGCAWLERDAVIGTHPAGQDQLMLVTTGSGIVSGKEGKPVEVSPGSAVLWEATEIHETRALASGLSAIIIQGRGLEAAVRSALA